jgi:hypothetical protein
MKEKIFGKAYILVSKMVNVSVNKNFFNEKNFTMIIFFKNILTQMKTQTKKS